MARRSRAEKLIEMGLKKEGGLPFRSPSCLRHYLEMFRAQTEQEAPDWTALLSGVKIARDYIPGFIASVIQNRQPEQIELLLSLFEAVESDLCGRLTSADIVRRLYVAMRTIERHPEWKDVQVARHVGLVSWRLSSSLAYCNVRETAKAGLGRWKPRKTRRKRSIQKSH